VLQQPAAPQCGASTWGAAIWGGGHNQPSTLLARECHLLPSLWARHRLRVQGRVAPCLGLRQQALRHCCRPDLVYEAAVSITRPAGHRIQRNLEARQAAFSPARDAIHKLDGPEQPRDDCCPARLCSRQRKRMHNAEGSGLTSNANL
jgi:hypothetical protein